MFLCLTADFGWVDIQRVSSLYFYLLLNVIALRNLLMTFRQYPEVIAKVSYLLLYSIALGTLSLSSHDMNIRGENFMTNF